MLVSLGLASDPDSLLTGVLAHAGGIGVGLTASVQNEGATSPNSTAPPSQWPSDALEYEGEVFSSVEKQKTKSA